MNFSNKKLYIIYKENNNKAEAFANEILAWLKKYQDEHHQYSLIKVISTEIIEDHLNAGQVILEKFHAKSGVNPDFAIILGGDGTILEAARSFAGTKTCIFGINFGKIGFLSATEPHNWKANFIYAIRHPEKIIKCAILKYNIYSGREKISGVAANDLVLGHGTISRLLDFEIKINGYELGPIRSDGLIFFTPLGSSAYNSSAGGPILLPELNVFGLTPICPFMSSLKSLGLSCTTICQIKVSPASSECFITVDGRINMAFSHENILEITGWPEALHIWLNEKKYFSQLAFPCLK